MVAVGCWLKGAFLIPGARLATKTTTIVVIVALLAVSGVYFIGDKFRGTAPENSAARADSDWQPFTPERLRAELAQNHTVFISISRRPGALPVSLMRKRCWKRRRFAMRFSAAES